MPDAIEIQSSRHTEERGCVFTLAAGFRHGIHEPQQEVSSGLEKVDLFGNQHIESLKTVSYTTLYTQGFVYT